MWDKLFAAIWQDHRGKAIGILLGLLASILFVTVGFWKTIFIILCLAVGYWIGKRIDDHQTFESWMNTFKNQR